MSFTEQLNEITFEITDFCEEGCKYCSSNANRFKDYAKFLSIKIIRDFLVGQHFKIIHISGGEPLAHPQFYEILRICKEHADDVVVHTNALTHICFNANVIDNIYIEANIK